MDREWTLTTFVVAVGLVLTLAYGAAVAVGVFEGWPSLLALVTVAVGTVGAAVSSRLDQADSAPALSASGFCFAAPVVILNLPTRTDPPFRTLFLVLGSGACVFAILLVVGTVWNVVQSR